MSAFIKYIQILFLLFCFSKLKKKIQGRVVTQNVSWGVIISTRSLVLQRVARFHAGNYGCAAANDRGENQSSIVNLRIHCKYHHLFSFFPAVLYSYTQCDMRFSRIYPISSRIAWNVVRGIIATACFFNCCCKIEWEKFEVELVDAYEE